MQTLTSGVRGIALLFNINWDLFFSVALILVALLSGAFFASAFARF